MQLVYRVKKLTDLPELIVNTPITAADFDETTNENVLQQSDFFTKQSNIGIKAEDIIMEIRLNGLGFNNARPVLSVLLDDVVWFYEMFVCDDGQKGKFILISP